MAIKGQAITVTVTAWDTVNNVPKTGDAANISVRLIKDGVSAARSNAAPLAEADPANAPGEYSVALNGADTTADTVVVAGRSSTSGVAIMPVKIVTESGRFSALSTAIGQSEANVTSILQAVGMDVSTIGGMAEDIQNRIGTPAGASASADIAALAAVQQSNTDALLAVDESVLGVSVVVQLIRDYLAQPIPADPAANSVLERIKTLDDAYTALRASYLDASISGLNDLSSGDIQAAAAAALAAYDPPTRAEATDDRDAVIAAIPQVVLGSDGKVLLSADPHAGASIPSVENVTGSVSGSVNNVSSGVTLDAAALDAVRAGLATGAEISAVSAKIDTTYAAASAQVSAVPLAVWSHEPRTISADVTLSAGDIGKIAADVAAQGVFADILAEMAEVTSAVDAAVGAGGTLFTYTVYDGPGVTPLAQATVWITSDAAGEEVVAGPQLSDTAGRTRWMLSPGTYYVWCQRARYIFSNPEQVSL